MIFFPLPCSGREMEQHMTIEEKLQNPTKPVDFSLTPRARRIWNSIDGTLQVKLLNNVWCARCRSTTGIGNVTGNVEKGMLALKGNCTRCGGPVARVIEND